MAVKNLSGSLNVLLQLLFLKQLPWVVFGLWDLGCFSLFSLFAFSFYDGDWHIDFDLSLSHHLDGPYFDRIDQRNNLLKQLLLELISLVMQ